MDPVTKQSFLGKYKLLVIGTFVLLVILIPVLLLSNSSHKSTSSNQSDVMVSPTTTQINSSNADSVLGQQDTEIQTNLNQVDSDIQSVDAIDPSQDSTTEL